MELRQFFYKSLIVVAIALGLYFLYEVRGILLLFFGAVLFASTIRPLVVYLKVWHIPPIISILVIYLAFLASLAAAVVFLFPTLLVNVRDLLESQNAIFLSVEATLERLQLFAASGTGLNIPVPSAVELQAQLNQLQATVQAHLTAYLVGGVQFASGAIILFVMAFYWLTERDRLEGIALRMAPLSQRERIANIVDKIEGMLGSFVRGQTILCGTVGVLSFIALSLLGVRSPAALAVFAALAEAIPMLGPILGAIPALLVALAQSPEKALLVAVAYLVIQQLESQLLVPKVMERQVGLSPLFVLLALTAGNLLGGIEGAVVSIPIAAVVKILVRDIVIEPTVEANKFPLVDGAVLLPQSANETAAEPVTVPASEPVEPVIQVLRTK